LKSLQIKGELSGQFKQGGNYMNVVILCGGFGTRFAEVTGHTPKPLIVVGDRPIVIHIMRWYQHYGHHDFFLPLGYMEEKFKNYFINYHMYQSDFSVDLNNGSVNIINECTTNRRVHLLNTGLQTETGGRLLRIKNWLHTDRFMMTYGDGLANININELLEYHKKQGKMVTVTAVRAAPRFGNLLIEEGVVKLFAEKVQTDDVWINGGFFVIEPQALDYIEGDHTSFEKDVLPILASEGQLAAFKHHGSWSCMDTQKDWQALEALWTSGDPFWSVKSQKIDVIA
jgi:glucose-1-phosphate cytidylyltransferase